MQNLSKKLQFWTKNTDPTWSIILFMCVWANMSIKRDYKTDDGAELEPLGGPKSPDKESKTNGVQFGK